VCSMGSRDWATQSWQLFMTWLPAPLVPAELACLAAAVVVRPQERTVQALAAAVVVLVRGALSWYLVVEISAQGTVRCRPV
jgi:hypothetical protein